MKATNVKIWERGRERKTGNKKGEEGNKTTCQWQEVIKCHNYTLEATH